MKKAISFFALAVLVSGVLATSVDSQPASGSAVDRLMSLVDVWNGNDQSGKPVADSIRLVSNNTALEGNFQSDQNHQMVTMYAPDGSRVALTHYCSMGNQPHMQTPALNADASEVVFSFISATNLASDNDKRLHRMMLKIEDSDHFSETWTLHVNGKEQTETFHFTRKR